MNSLDRIAEFKHFESGRLFCLRISQENSLPSKVLLIVPPFAEEMNKSRKMMSLLLDEIAAENTAGYLFDLFGTGDSAGDFREATWGIWRANLVSMIDFIASQNGVEQISIVAIRTGALLVNSVLAEESAIADKIQSIHYWNPVFNASIFIGQFLRLKLAANMMRSNGPKVGAKELRQELLEKGRLEVAGYTLNHALVEGMEATTITLHPSLSHVPLHFYELSSLGQITPGLKKKINEVRESAELSFTHAIKGAQFWGTQEISLCDPLLALTKEKLFTELETEYAR
jgi:exosortase A-associated hydrolase 2